MDAVEMMQSVDESEAMAVDGIDSRDISLDSLRSRIGVVSQDPFIFNGTIRENIALGQSDAGMPAIVAAARAAGLDQFIDELPERYETVIGERGSNLSGGQRQRLAIARALVRNPEILIFDEATSNLDTATEQVIRGNLKGALVGKTVVMVAHRLSTIREADRVYVLQRGRVVEHGAPRELIANNGVFATLWRAQIGDSDLPSPSPHCERRMLRLHDAVETSSHVSISYA